jgi:hypothetical protein
MRCSDPSEASLQADYASELAGDYLTESQKMFEWVSHLATEDHAQGAARRRRKAARKITQRRLEVAGLVPWRTDPSLYPGS